LAPSTRAEKDVNLEGDVKSRNLGALTPPVNSMDISWDNPQTPEAGLSYKLTDEKTLFFNAGREDLSDFSDNELDFTGAAVVTLDRNWEDARHSGIALAHIVNREGYSAGLSYESSPVDDDHRTFDLPVDELYRLSATYSWTGSQRQDFSLGGSLMMFGDTSIDNTVHGVRVECDFDSNYVLILGGTLGFVF
jgi:long-subunit fatty acid transport protein